MVKSPLSNAGCNKSGELSRGEKIRESEKDHTRARYSSASGFGRVNKARFKTGLGLEYVEINIFHARAITFELEIE